MEDRSFRFGLDPYKGQEMNIWQGTVIKNSREHPRLVISADCDLLESKSGGLFFYLDVVPTDSYLHDYALADTVETRLEVIRSAAKDLVTSRNPAFERVSSGVFADWLLLNRTRWASDMPGAHPAELDLLDALAAAAAHLVDFGSTGNLTCDEEKPSIFVQCANLQQAKKIDLLNKKIKELVQARLQASRLDHFIFPEIPGVDGDGHFVPFRSIRAMPRSEVCDDRTEMIEHKAKFYPIAVCRPVLISSLMQKFMTYFMRIGHTNVFRSQQEKVVKETMGAVQ